MTDNIKKAVALGIFDGLHCGHRYIIQNAVEYLKYELVPAVFTFRTESIDFKHGKPFEFIFTNELKLKKLKELGIEYVFSPDFDEVKNLSGEEFVSEILINKMNAGAVVCGENFRFGKNASCGAAELKDFGERYGFDVRIIKLIEGGFSSEKYRSMLRDGKVRELYDAGNVYTVYAQVAEGNKIGRTIDFPTINQHFSTGQLVPKRGVYKTETSIDGIIYKSITNVGVKPTVEENIQPLAETHILGYSGNLYGRKVEVRFIGFIRPEKKFNSVEQLRMQIRSDIDYAK